MLDRVLGAWGLLALLLVPGVWAQRPAPSQGAFVRVQSAQFRSTGDLDTLAYDFDAPLVGIGYARPGLFAELAYGTATAPAGRVSILDGDLSTSSARPLYTRGQTVLTLPVRLGFSYRRVRLRSQDALGDFEVTTLGIALGLAGRAPAGRATLDAALMGGAGLASRNFDGTPGFGYTAEAQAGLRAPLSERFGLAVGYRFRFRLWNLDEGRIGPVRAGDLYDYRALDHGVHLGLTF